jgi:hypothetical protein
MTTAKKLAAKAAEPKGLPPPEATIEEARALASAISSRMDQLNEKLHTAQEVLGRLGITAVVDISTADEKTVGRGCYLSIEKEGADWLLNLFFKSPNPDKPSEVVDVLRASKANRIRAGKELPKFTALSP